MINSLEQLILFLKFLIRGLCQAIKSTSSTAQGVKIRVDLQAKEISKKLNDIESPAQEPD